MASTATVASERSRLSGVHVLQLLAVLALMVYHYTYRYAVPGESTLPLSQRIARHGFLGIDVFLMVSGFLIVCSARGHTATEFVRARVLRRFPEFWIAVLVSGLIFHFAPIHTGRIPSVGTVVANLSMVPQLLGFPMVDALYEILSEEVRFSLVIWGVVLLGLVKRIDRFLFAIIALSLVGTVTSLPVGVRALIDFPVGPLFAIGGLLALVHDSGWTATRATAVILALLASCVFALREMTSYVDPAHIDTVASFTTVLIIVVACAVMATLGARDIGARDIGTGLGRYVPVACALAYPLLLLESTGKAVFLMGIVNGPRPLLLLAAVAFSFTAAFAVMKIGTGPVRSRLRRSIDSAVLRASLPEPRTP